MFPDGVVKLNKTHYPTILLRIPSSLFASEMWSVSRARNFSSDQGHKCSRHGGAPGSDSGET